MTLSTSVPTRAARLLAGGLLAASVGAALASSHREAPFITTMPKVDATDWYMFRSYEAGREGFVTLIANYVPLQDAYGGPNYFQLDPNALYEMHIDNNGDAKEDITFQFRFSNTSKDIALNVGGKSVAIPLIQAGPVAGVNPATLNVRETYTVTVVRGDRRAGARQPVAHATTGATTFDKPLDNVGDKTFPGGYAAYAAQHTYPIAIPGCGTPARMFVGQRKDPFMIPVGKIFDLINLNPLGPTANGNNDDLADKNVTSMVLEVPIACLTNGSEPVIGGWTTASVRQGRLVNGAPASGINAASTQGGPWAQVSRLGMPLVNEVVIGLKDKDRFNASKPVDDRANFADYVTNPTLPALIQTLFPSAPAPTNVPRTDLVAAFLTGLKLRDGTVVNQPRNVVPSEMLRLNTAIPPTPKGAQNNLGVAGGDLAGFPNGRRPGDDVVDIELRVAMGALCVLTTAADTLGVGCRPSDAPAGSAPITDGVLTNAAQFPDGFPYLNTPLRGSP